MPLEIPPIDERRYKELLQEAIARIPVYTPEWTNHYETDPGITLLELFAFMTENLLYRANQIPERNRLKFLQLLGINLQPGTVAQGIVSIHNEKGTLETITLNKDLEVRAGDVPFRTTMGLDVLPIEAQVYYKRPLPAPSKRQIDYYTQLYASYVGAQPISIAEPQLYETVPLNAAGDNGLDMGTDNVVDGSVWIALMLRQSDVPYQARLDDAREALSGRKLNVGIVPNPPAPERQLKPVGNTSDIPRDLLQFQIPNVPPDGNLPTNVAQRVAQYRPLESVSSTDVLHEPGIVQVTLPPASQMILWNNLDPLEAGVGGFPPVFEDTELNNRIITWIRITPTAPIESRFLWISINAVPVQQRARVNSERLPNGTGEPDQMVTLINTPVIPESVRMEITHNGVREIWQPIDDLLAAGAEVPVPDSRQPLGSRTLPDLPTKVYQLDPESGTVRFGNGTHGARPPFGASIRASYDYGAGRRGNLGANNINSSSALPASLKVKQPIPTWGGADPETVADGERHIARYLQHRDRLVTVNDFETITKRTPGVDVGRVEVLPAFNPRANLAEPGAAPGGVTLLLVPQYDPHHLLAPQPDRLFLDAVCEYIDSRRLVTTEVFLRGPSYQDIWISVGIEVEGQTSLAVVSQEVKKTLEDFLHPLDRVNANLREVDQQGWDLNKTVHRLELWAIANRVPGVRLVNGLVLYDKNGTEQEFIEIRGLELPRVRGIAVGAGMTPLSSQIPGLGTSTPDLDEDGTNLSNFVPVPVAPEDC